MLAGSECVNVREERQRRTDDRTAESDVPPEVYVACNCEMVQLNDMRYLLEPLLELRDLRKRKKTISAHPIQYQSHHQNKCLTPTFLK